MTKKSFHDAAVSLATVGGAVLAVGLARDAINKIVELPDAAYTTCVILGLALPVLAAVSFATSFVVEQVALVIYGDHDAKYLCRAAAVTDLPALHTLYSSYFGDDVPPIPLMTDWLTRCDTAFTLVHKISDREETREQKLVGSFKVLPLTAKGVRAIELGQVTGSTFKPDHIASRRSRPTAFYVGDVAATTRVARAVVLAHLNAAVFAAARGTVTVYARPLTRDGLRVMSKHGFVQVSDGRSMPAVGRICKLVVEGRVGLVPTRSRRTIRLVPMKRVASSAA